jgi:hypothetical protein
MKYISFAVGVLLGLTHAEPIQAPLKFKISADSITQAFKSRDQSYFTEFEHIEMFLKNDGEKMIDTLPSDLKTPMAALLEA